VGCKKKKGEKSQSELKHNFDPKNELRIAWFCGAKLSLSVSQFGHGLFVTDYISFNKNNS